MAGTIQNTPHDEIQWRRPEVIQWWGGINANTIHPIFRESPFFDHTTKNGLLWDQAQNDPRTWDICINREALETRLKSMNGVEYIITSEPERVDDPVLMDTGIWILKKQNRTKRAPREDEVTLLETFYVVGENFYKAPSVYDIVGNHLLSTMNSLSKFIDIVKPLPIFTPALGYTYYQPTTSKLTPASQMIAATQSSRESSVAPSSQAAAAAALEGAAQAPPNTTASGQAPDPRESYAIAESLHMMMRYGDEYMDENPLRGEPGNFTFSATKERIRAKAAEAEAAKVREAERAKKLEEIRTVAAATPFAGTNPTGTVKTEAVNGDGKSILKKAKTEKRKKRRAGIATSPTSPMTPATPATPASAS